MIPNDRLWVFSLLMDFQGCGVTVARSELTDLLWSAGFGDDFSLLLHAHGFLGFSKALHTSAALQGARSRGAICSFVAFESQTSYFPPPALPLQAKLGGTSSIAPSCLFSLLL